MAQESVLDKIASREVAVHVVWTPVLRGDDREAAVEAAKEFLQDPRAVHYWDGDRDLGMLYGKLLTLPADRDLAWDIYFAFDAGAVWEDEAPIPSEWAHQLGLDERHLGDGGTFLRAVEGLLSSPVAAEPED